MIPADETFDGTWPFAARYFEGRGFRQHYIDEGSADTGETFLLVHGEPTWGYLWRHFVAPLSQLGRVLVVDHMGFGKSETPQDRSYSAEEHVDNLEALLLDLDATGITLIGQDWGGPIGTHVALRHPERFERLVYIDSFAQPPVPPPDVPRELLRASTPWFGLALDDHFDEVILNLRFTALSVLQRIGIQRTEVIDDTWVRAYSAPFPTAAECKGARQFPLNLLEPATHAFFEANAARPGALHALEAKPAALFVGEADPTVTPPLAEMLLRAWWPDAPAVVLPGASHYAPEDQPEALLKRIEEFVQTNALESR